MAKLTIKIASTGEEFEIEDVALNQLTFCQLIDEMINQGLLPPETIVPYGIINKDCVGIDDEHLYIYLAQLGFVDGDTIKIIVRGSCGGEGTGWSPANELFTFIPQPRKGELPSKQEPNESGNYCGGALAGTAVGAGDVLRGGVLGGGSRCEYYNWSSLG